MNTDYDYIRQLVELMGQHDLSRIELHEGDTHIVVRRGQTIIAAPTSAAPPVGHSAPVVAAAPPASPSPATTTNSPAAADVQETLIKSPMVGTYYAAPDPESPAFVHVGATIGPQTVVCLIEAMKVFNEIKAECAGRVTRVLVKNGEAVEFDQPLFAVAAG